MFITGNTGCMRITQSAITQMLHALERDAGLTTGTVQQVRARAIGGSTGQSAWCMPGSKIVD